MTNQASQQATEWVLLILVNELGDSQLELGQVHLEGRPGGGTQGAGHELHVALEAAREAVRGRAALVAKGPGNNHIIYIMTTAQHMHTH